MTPELRARAVQFFSQRQEFCGWWLLRHREREGLDEAQQAEWLRCTPEQLQSIALCLHPLPHRWQAGIDQIAGRFSADAARLSQALMGGEDPDGTD